MQFIIFMTLPGLVILLTVIAFVDYLLRATGRGRRTGRVSATGFEQLHASFSPGKATQLRERHTAMLMKDDDEDGAPPNRSSVDLDGGVAVVRLPSDPARDHR
ncbi:DUF6191 domain-containing protein [Streptomyces sp. NPDC058953]|uniref:DUF6191 domain-containing protein n=1 Tax=unclassified Streptomyces TaxID=2593676 RepID=UPI0036A03D91